MSSSLGKVAHCDTLIARELGSKSRPIETIHTASTFEFQNDLSFKDAEQTKFVIQKNGHLAVSQDVHFYDSSNISTAQLRYSLGLNDEGTKFVIKNEQTNTIVFEADNMMSNIQGLVDALNTKQAKLTVNGDDISPSVLNTFTLTSGGDGISYNNSLVTAGALENFIENVLQPSMITVQAGQASGVRVGSIPTQSPSNVNIPSVKAVHDYLQAHYMTISEIGSSYAAFNHNHNFDYVPIPTNASFGGAGIMRNQSNTGWEYAWPILFHMRLTPSGNGDVTFDPVSKTIVYTPPSLNFMPLPNGSPVANDVVQWDGSNWIFNQVSSSGGSSPVSLSTITDWPQNVSAAEISFLDGVTQSVQIQLNNKLNHPVNGTLSLSDHMETSLVDPADSNSVQGLTIDTGKMDGSFYDFSITGIPRLKRALRLECTHPSSSTSKVGATWSIGGSSSQIWFDCSSTPNDYLMFGWNNPSTNLPSQSNGWNQIWFVANQTQIFGSMNVQGSLLINGSTVSTSDERIKRNIKAANISLAYDLAARIEIHEYDYVDESRTHNEFGFIAQQVESVIPDAVQTLNGDYNEKGEKIPSITPQEKPTFQNLKQVDKNRLFQLLFGAFKQAQIKINALENRIEKLEAQAF